MHNPTLSPGQLLARGASRYLTRAFGMATIEELVPTRGLRVDVMALSAKGEIWVIECKSGRSDFQSDHKWHRYLEWCDRFFWAVDADFPSDLLPDTTGLLIADGYGAEMIREAPLNKLPPARRKAMTLTFARCAANRAQAARDPGAAGLSTI